MADLASQLLVPKVRDLFFDANGRWVPSRFKVMKGGRGALKTWGFSRTGTLISTQRKLRILCAREFQTSIQESVHRALSTQIEALNLEPYFDVQKTQINTFCGSEFIFAGIRNNPKKIKSLEGVDICWVEEAENITEESWQILIPTIRKSGSEIWVSFNPDLQKDPTSQRFIEAPPPPELARIITTNWRDNPWLSDELRADKDYLARVDPDAYQHVWEGGYRQNSAAQVLRGKISIEAFERQIDWDGPYQGADWGFSQDPATLVRVWIAGNKLYVEYESYGIGIDTNLLPEKFDRDVPMGANYVTRGDNARPETISFLQKHGYPKMTACTKWKGSVEDGVAFLRQFEKIVIHPRCEHAIEEGRLWSYKVDRLTGDPLPELAERHDHIWDAVRYALQPLIKRTGSYSFTSI